jgi:indolepyruvate ferredoxin oxidoreductase
MIDQGVRAAPADRYRVMEGTIHLTGIQALARLVIDVRRADLRAGRRTAAFVSGYEGSPLGGYDLELQRRRDLLDEYDVVFRPAVNEELAATAVQGTQLAATFPDRRVDGVTGFWYGKSPGLDRAVDALRHGNLAGTHPDGGAVALVGDDPAAKSSTVPGASERVLADLGIPVLYPADSQDVLDLGLHAVAMSRASGLWTALKIVTNVADGAGRVEVGPERIVPVPVPGEAGGEPYRHEVVAKLLQPALDGLERSRDGVRLDVARRYAALNGLDRLTGGGPDDRIGIVAAGKTFLDLRQALRVLGLDDAELARRGVRLLRLAMIHPIEPGIVERFAAGLREIIVVEEKRPFIETAIKELLYGRADAPVVRGKRNPDGGALLPSAGDLDADVIARRLAPVLAGLGDFPSVRAWLDGAGRERRRVDLPIVPRTPYFCSGCPHNTSTKTPEGSLVGAGIGCHTLVLMMTPDQVGEIAGLTQMGGEGAQWIGMAPFVEREHLLQNLGDGTFHHSGSLAVRAAVAAGVNVTYKLLYNSAVAMTGGQSPAGVMAVPELVRTLLAEGVARIIVTTDDVRRYRGIRLPRGVEVWDRSRIVEAQRTLAKVPGVTVLVHDQECATELRRKRKRGLAPEPAERVMINERVCEGCGDCGRKSNCLSVQPVETEFGRKTRIHQSSCNKDYSCVEGDCPAFLTVLPGRGRPGGAAKGQDEPALPEPPRRAAAASHVTRITGVGGTGVVTLSQILGTAAALAGKHASTLDQTGLAQKGGAVVSDITIADAPIERSNKASEGTCDLYLGCDLLVAANRRHLGVADPDRTVAVVSTTKVPTGRMVTDTRTQFPDVDRVADGIRAATRDAVFLDARELAENLLGDDQYANVLLAGAAYQKGALPLPADAIEEAIRLNGARVEANLRAFRLGRRMVAEPEAFAGTRAVRAEPGSELARLVGVRVPELVAYQDEAYARRYADTVERVRRAEAEKAPGNTALAEAVARNLYKLMAYKDEYEVARLSIAPEVEAAVRERFGDGARFAYRLHPPLLRALGMKRKLTLGRWSRPALAALARMRRLRGTRLDPFGHTRVRRVERELIAEYEAVVNRLIDALTPGTHELAVRIAELPDMIRGYEDVKLRNVAAYRERLAELTRELPAD